MPFLGHESVVRTYMYALMARIRGTRKHPLDLRISINCGLFGRTVVHRMREALGAVGKSFLGTNPTIRVQKNYSPRPPIRFNHPPRPIRRARPLRVWQVRYDAELAKLGKQFCWNRLQKVA